VATGERASRGIAPVTQVVDGLQNAVEMETFARSATCCIVTTASNFL
jgi:hypothetical protein